MTAQAAAGALAAYMHENGIATVNPNKLYQLAYSPAAGTPSTVSKAAKFMLANSDTYNRIETHDVKGSDGISGVANFDWAAEGGLGAASNKGGAGQSDAAAKAASEAAAKMAIAELALMAAQSAAGAIASFMHEKGMKTVDPDELYQIAYHPKKGTPPGVSAAAKFMLANPDVYNRIETHDVKGSDGISGVKNFDWAAEGGLGAASNKGGAKQSEAAPKAAPEEASKEAPKADSETAPKAAPKAATGESAQLNAQSASGAVAAYMHEQGIKKVDPDQLYQIAYNPKKGTPSEVSAAAKFMLANPDTFNKIETHDVKGSDGISGTANFDWAAQGGVSHA